jgi:2'-5' RNA ligase
VHLHAAFVPPAPVRQALVALVSVEQLSSETAPASRRGFFARRTAESPMAASGPQLNVLEPEQVVLPITDFGYLASGDARRLVDALIGACAALPVPTVRVSGGAALVDPDDRSVWADLSASDDEVGAMRAIAQAVVTAVEPLGLYCDRRRFRPRFPIARITDHTTVEHLEQVLAALSSYTSEPWTVDEVSVLQRGSGAWRSVPVGG